MYREHFGLNEDPFGVTPDPKFLYCSATHAEALASLHYGLLERRGLMVLIAGPGLGKTTLLLYLLERWRERAATAFVLRPPETRDQMIAAVLNDLGQTPTASYAENCRLLVDRAVECRRKGKRLLVVFDEAQNIPREVLEEIRLLTNLEAPGEKWIEVILAGQPELADRLAPGEAESLGQRVVISTEIQPLDASEVRRYVEHRLQIAGLKNQKLFTSRALVELARESLGIPRKINNLCFQALSDSLVEGRKKVDDAALRKVLPSRQAPAQTESGAIRWVAAAVFVVIAAGALASSAYWQGRERPAHPTVPQPIAVAAVPASGSLEQEPAASDRVQVQPGDTLRQIALRQYGRWDAEVWEHIQRSNPDLADPDKVQAGRVVVLPAWERSR